METLPVIHIFIRVLIFEVILEQKKNSWKNFTNTKYQNKISASKVNRFFYTVLKIKYASLYLISLENCVLELGNGWTGVAQLGEGILGQQGQLLAAELDTEDVWPLLSDRKLLLLRIGSCRRTQLLQLPCQGCCSHCLQSDESKTTFLKKTVFLK